MTKKPDWSFLDSELVREWAITATIPHFKKINYGGIYRAFSRFTTEQQKDILRSFLTKAIVWASETPEIYPIEIYYETHEKGHQHAHATLKGMTLNEMLKVNTHYNSLIGVKSDKLAYLLFKEKVSEGWTKYIKKQQAGIEDLEADLMEIEKAEAEQKEIRQQIEESYNRLFVNF